MRVVSLVPSVTESLLAWGVTPVGVTRWCLHPELPQVGGTKDPDVEAIRALAPDLVVLCDEENRLEDAEALAAAAIATHTIRVRSVDDVAPEMESLARRLHVDARVTPVTQPAAGDRRRAFVPIWRQAARGGDPAAYTTISADTYGASVLRACGVAGVYDDSADRYPTTTLAEAAARGADLVVAPSEPYPFGPRHRRELEAVGPVVFVDGQDLFWWGARTPAAVRRLGRALSP